MTVTASALDYLLSPQAVRDRTQQLFDRCCREQLAHFRYDPSQLDRVADYVIATMQEQYPNGNVPFHSRWRHFDVGGVPRQQQLDEALSSARVAAKAKVDLAVVSVLLDAGAGPDWRYSEAASGQTFARSEGLAVASYQMFCQGAFSGTPQQPHQVDAPGLQHLSEAQLQAGLQISPTNPLVGISGRLKLLQQLGQALAAQPERFGYPARPGNLIDYFQHHYGSHLKAAALLTEVLKSFGSIWPGRLETDGVNLGDVWTHSALAGEPYAEFVPFHKLSQWLTYSLVEPLTEAGLTIGELDGLTGLAEYRNGGLCVDLGLLQPKHAEILGQAHLPSSEVIVEWRALTLVCLDLIAERMRQKLNVSSTELPLMKVLEGGTWSAGRRIARELRPGGPPPILLDSDGTVF
ncbi:MAG: URC4/urg3 family protein [Cyanophyceae cyanobacterium]